MEEEEPLRFSNFDLENIFTPVNVDELEKLLIETNYPHDKIKMLTSGFRNGFTLGYEGREDVKLTSPNLKLRVGSELELWNKVMKEVKELRYAGPFKDIPFKDKFIQSPIGLVPKDNGKKTRLIFHLSYPQDNSKMSVNVNTPKEMCSVVYPDFSKAVKLCMNQGQKCFCSKSDWMSAFRHFPIKRGHWNYLVMKVKDPKDRLWYYFVDKCMPFGSSISCAHFQAFSDAVSFIMKAKTGLDNVNYLDDFLFIAFLKWLCDSQVQTFLNICERIRFPVTLEKTLWSTTVIVFLGMLLDTEKQIVLIPNDKICKAREQIADMIASKKKRKTTVQKLCGLLNFLCRAIFPDRPFLMCLYNSLAGFKNKTLKSHHHVKLAQDTILDLKMRDIFLQSPMAYCRPFIDFNKCVNAHEIGWCTDAAKAAGKDFGGHVDSHWFAGLWEESFLEKDPSIESLELYAVAVSVLLWTKIFKNKRIMLLCDNESVVCMINKQSSKCKNCMVLIHIITLECLIHNVRLYATHLRTHLNGRADVLSRDKINRFRQLSQQSNITIDKYPKQIPELLLDPSAIWIS